jgi:hypothetical protein
MSFFKSEGQEEKTGLVWRLVPVEGGEARRKGCRRVSMVEMLHTHI